MNEPYAYLLTKALLTLITVLGLMGLSLWAFRKSMGKGGKLTGRKPGAPIKVVTTSFLGQKKNLAVVEVAGEMLVLGVTPTSINFLTKIESSQAKEELKKLKTRSGGLFNLF
ncbi:MAG: flagellar biosynthetic protein FliO [Deltaproteobacteria bacterium]|nr:flagellar biosynthetic protein FliO [Deltaproteobacteria bacterium]